MQAGHNDLFRWRDVSRASYCLSRHALLEQFCGRSGEFWYRPDGFALDCVFVFIFYCMHYLMLGLLNFFFWVLSLLPLRMIYLLGGGLGRGAAALPGRYGRRLRANFLQAYPQATSAMLIDAARSAGRMALEMPYFWSRTNPLAAFPDLLAEHQLTINRILAEGRGVIFLTPHLGCFEILAPVLAARYGLTAMFKPPHKIWLRAWVEKMRSCPGLQLAPAQQSGVRMLVKALRQGQAIGILPDQVPAAGQGVWAPFFGRPAYTLTLVHKLHRISGAPIVLLFGERLSAGRGYRIHLQVLSELLPVDSVAAATMINDALESLIALAPTQYLWAYNRYKSP